MKTAKEIQSTSDSIPQYNIIKAIRIILSNDDCIPNGDVTATLGTLSKLVTILRNPSLSQVFTYLITYGAASSWVLQVQLGLPEASIYRCLRSLNANGYITPQHRFVDRLSHRSGPRPKIWGVIDCTSEQVAEAINLHQRCLSPKYRVAEEIAQTLLTRYVVNGEITYRDLLAHVKATHAEFRAPDVADLAAQYLAERGIKVWR
jgi:hypothetical protein